MHTYKQLGASSTPTQSPSCTYFVLQTVNLSCRFSEASEKINNRRNSEEIICKDESGTSVSKVSAEYGIAKSTICTILKKKKKLKTKMI